MLPTAADLLPGRDITHENRMNQVLEALNTPEGGAEMPVQVLNEYAADMIATLELGDGAKNGQSATLPTATYGDITSAANMTRYATEIDGVFTGDLPLGQAVNVGPTPSILVDHGAPALNLRITQEAARKIAYPEGYFGGKHNLGMSALKQLPYQLSDPIAILKSSSQPNSLVIVTAWKTADGMDVIIPVHLSKQGVLTPVNDIPTAYGTSHIDTILGENNENVLYTKNDEDIHQLLSRGLQLPAAMADDVLARNSLTHTTETVNPGSLPTGASVSSASLPTAARATGQSTDAALTVYRDAILKDLLNSPRDVNGAQTFTPRSGDWLVKILYDVGSPHIEYSNIRTGQSFYEPIGQSRSAQQRRHRG